MIPPMRRRLPTILAAASVALCVAMPALRVRSYWIYDEMKFK